MRRISVVLGGLFVIVCFLLAVIQGWFGELSSQSLRQLEQTGYFAIGWGTGVTGWLLSGHLAIFYLLRKAPRAWRLWRKDVLLSPLPVFKYLAVGLFSLGLGAIGGYRLWDFFMQVFNAGLLVGAVLGFLYSIRKVYQSAGNQIDFFEANQRYLNRDEVPLFSEEWAE